MFHGEVEYKASVNDILVSGQDFPSQPSGWAVIIIHYVIILMNGYYAIVVHFL